MEGVEDTFSEAYESDVDDLDDLDDLVDYDTDTMDDDFGDFDEEDEGEAAEAQAVVECLTPADLIGTQLQHIEEVNTIFQIPPGIARILLAHFNWDKERLLERYFGGDQDKLFAEVHVVNPHSQPKKGEQDPDEELTCEICYVDYPAKEMTGLECNHTFCVTCWNHYLRGKIVEQGTQQIACPALGCPILVDELTVTRLINDDVVLRKYQYLTAKAFVANNKHVKWCPAPGCDNAVRLAIVEPRPVQCSCGHNFCFECGQEAHDPVWCEMLRLWLKKCEDDSETSNWIAVNTKECPKCRSTIEKNGGCNHMVCRSPSCKYEFCWVCLGPWEPHGSSWYNCNRFEESDAVEARGSASKSRESLERYLFYYNRFANHQQSRQLEGKLSKLVERKQHEMQEANMSWIEVQFLSEALKTLSACRTMLKYTYVFAYYLKNNNECELFKSNQKDLENATETLSGYLEGDASGDELQKLRQSVLDKTKYCESRRKVLLEHVQEGHGKRAWLYQPDSVHEMMAKVYGA